MNIKVANLSILGVNYTTAFLNLVAYYNNVK
jgi:hypothetical protein